MRQKYNRAKLRLSRETLYALQHDDLGRINGGVAYTGCDSACTQCGGKPTRPQPPNPLGPRSGVICGADPIGNGGTLR